jgi:uncharacterized protein (DUF2235 family)
MSLMAKAADMAVAWYLEAHGVLGSVIPLPLSDPVKVQHGYIFLMNNYQPGDRICLVSLSG